MKTLQTTLGVADEQQLKQTWAFATKQRVILSCSRQAKILGIQSGMHIEDARTLLPDMRILVIGGQNV